MRTISLSDGEAESGYRFNPADALTPEQTFNRRWAITLVNRVVDRLQTEYKLRDQLPLFDALHGTLTGDVTAGYATLAGQLHTTQGALQVAAHRMRKRYRELLREQGRPTSRLLLGSAGVILAVLALALLGVVISLV